MAHNRRFDRMIRVASLAVAAVAAFWPLLLLWFVLLSPTGPEHVGMLVAAVAAFTPLNVWLVWSALHGRRGPTQLWGLVGVAVLAYGLLPVIGADWTGMSSPVAALALVLLRAPWSWLAFAAVVAARWLTAHAMGYPEFSLYESLAAMNLGIAMAVLIWLIDAARRLEAARIELAEAAVVRERERLDASLRETVGAALREIRAGAERASSAIDGGRRDDADRALADVAAVADAAAGQARRMVSRIQPASLLAQLRAAVDLLSAAGIRARFSLPSDGVPDHLDEEDAQRLHAVVASLLQADSPADCEISVRLREGRPAIDVAAVPA